jgi:hypothetical protein
MHSRPSSQDASFVHYVMDASGGATGVLLNKKPLTVQCATLTHAVGYLQRGGTLGERHPDIKHRPTTVVRPAGTHDSIPKEYGGDVGAVFDNQRPTNISRGGAAKESMKIHDESQIYDDAVPSGGMMFDLSAEDAVDDDDGSNSGYGFGC